MSKTAIHGNIYLDHAAKTPIADEVCKTILTHLKDTFENPSSMHEGGRRARRLIDGARENIANHLNASPDEIIFTGSGTEANNLALVGSARAYSREGDHIIISATEHKSILEPALALMKEGFRVTVVPVDRYGRINPESVSGAIEEKTILISLIYANNELGSINPIQAIAQEVSKKRAKKTLPLFHTDACQAPNCLAIDVQSLGIDLMTINSEKVYGPPGIAAVYKKRGVRLAPILRGGEQEFHLRAGTENTPLIMGFSTALDLARLQIESEVRRLSVLRTYFVSLLETIPGLTINGHPQEVLPNIVHVVVSGVEGEALLLMLDAYGIAVSTGSACSAFDLKPSHVLSAIGMDSQMIHGSIRFSFGRETSKENLDYVYRAFRESITRLRSLSAVGTHAYEMQQS